MTPKGMKTVLVHEWVTGGGLAGESLPASWAAEGRAMRRAIARDFASVPGIQVVMTLDAGLLEEPGPWTTVLVGPGEERERLGQLAVPSDFIVVIAPESRGILAERAEWLAKLGAQSLGSTSEAIALTGDKLRLSAFFSQHQVRTPRTQRVVSSQGLPEDFPYPAVLKPIDGAGSIDTFLVPNSSFMLQEMLTQPEALLQPFITGLLMSASFLVGSGRSMLVGVGQQNVMVREGRFSYEGGMIPANQSHIDESVTAAVESVPGLAGFIGVDYIWDELRAQATILEVNPRPTTSYVGLARILPPGRLAQAWIDIVLGKPSPASVDLAQFVHSHHPLYFRADGTIAHEKGGVKP